MWGYNLCNIMTKTVTRSNLYIKDSLHVCLWAGMCVTAYAPYVLKPELPILTCSVLSDSVIFWLINFNLDICTAKD